MNLKLVPTEPVEAGYVNPEELHTVLRAADTQVVTFATLKAMNRYRARLYSINKDGIRRYRTMRDELSMYGIIIYRIK